MGLLELYMCGKFWGKIAFQNPNFWLLGIEGQNWSSEKVFSLPTV